MAIVINGNCFKWQFFVVVFLTFKKDTENNHEKSGFDPKVFLLFLSLDLF